MNHHGKQNHAQYRCMVFNQIGLKPVCSVSKKAIYIDLVFFFSGKEATGRMVSHNKETDQTVKTQNFPAGKTFPATQDFNFE